jgi:uncharacterized protein (DUF2141 family)
MKSLTLILTIVLNASFAFSQSYTLTVNITHLKNNEGVVMIKLMDANENIVKGLEGKIIDEKCTVKIDNLAAGSYALSFFHDANSNGKLDMKSYGPPAEGYGFSNNAHGFMGPPKFKDQLFDINSDLTITLKTGN